MTEVSLRLPDFVIIGAMKSATSSLQEQLSRQPGIFMSTPKEPNFFSDDQVYKKGIHWYASLFEDAGQSDLLGEASTHYTKLPTWPKTIERLASEISQARFVYVMRHPVDRLVSHYIHQWTMNEIKCDINEAVSLHPEMIEYGLYNKQLSPWLEHFGPERILPVFFDRLLSHPQAELERVCRHIGYQGTPKWESMLSASNVSSERIRRFPLYDLLVDSVPATWIRKRFIPVSFREAVKKKLQVKQRPLLRQHTHEQLIKVFDEDLAQLGKRLNYPIRCENFRQVTAEMSLEWAESQG